MKVLIDCFKKALIYAYVVRNTMMDINLVMYFLTSGKKIGKYTMKHGDLLDGDLTQKHRPILNNSDAQSTSNRNINPMVNQFQYGGNKTKGEEKGKNNICNIIKNYANIMMGIT